MPANRWRGPKRNNHTQASVPPGAGVFFMSDFVLPFSADKRRGTSGWVVSNIFRKFIFVRQLNAPYPADSFSVSSLVETR